MKTIRQLAWLLVIPVLLCSCAAPPQPVVIPEATIVTDPDALVFDSAVIRGSLENGLTYMIRENGKPEGRVELRLVVDAGSILEDDDQQGLAHFLEHMAFNGTDHFEKNELVDYLESIGMAFGPDLNAYTSFDETVYMLQVPTEDHEILETAFQILADWASGMTLDPEEIDKERGVIIEEWRGRRGAQQRIRDKQFPILFKDSQYAERLPIGKKDILETFSHDTLRRFYEDWYRPDLQTVIAVGDIESARLEKLIHKYFGPLQSPREPVARPTYDVPDQPDRRVSIVTDPEATQTSVNVYHLREVDPLKTRTDYRAFLRDDLFSTMLNLRFAEIVKKPDAPFLGAGAFKGNFIRSKGVFALSAGVEDDGLARGLEAVLAEAERLKRFGFTEGELERARVMSLRGIQVAYNEREKTESSAFAREYVSSVTEGQVSPGVEAELRMHEEMLGAIGLAELNGLIGEWITDSNCVVLASGPEKDDVELPGESDLAALFGAVAMAKLDPYVDDVAEGPLVPQEISAGSVAEKSEIPELGVHVWTLSNGIRMILKPTDFKEDEIRLSVFSPGGHSLVEEDAFIPASSAAGAVREGGVGNFSLIQLEKKLAGKVVSVSPFIGELEEGLSGACSPEDLEDMMQLLYLSFTAPRADEEAFQALQDRRRAQLENRLANPQAVFSDQITEIMSQGHPRRKPWTPETVDEMDLATSMRIYRERFADADDFTFVWVGNIDLVKLEALASTYLASLPVFKGEEAWVDREVRRPAGSVSLDVRKGIEDKGQVVLAFWGPLEWSFAERFHLQSLGAALRIRLREALREDLGGTYGVGVGPSTRHYPRSDYFFQIVFGCAPDRMDSLIDVVNQELEAIKSEPLEDIYLQKVKEGQLRKRETDLKKNGFWLSTLQYYEWHEEDPLTVLEFENYVNALTAEDIRAAAEKYLGTENQALFTLRPETKATPEAEAVAEAADIEEATEAAAVEPAEEAAEMAE